MSKTIQQRGTRTRHDPSLVRRLLSEREASGETFVDLETRSGIPASTLASCARRQGSRAPKRRAFVEVVAAPAEPGPVSEEGDVSIEVLLSSPHGMRRLLVPAGFDPEVLRRVVDALEEPC